ncbi:MAG TPA: hypothetical protein VMT15_19380 [Bryobacteraceae bacterium]|nr:hypothetical protein [Bryobacteraceae bacterium]
MIPLVWTSADGARFREEERLAKAAAWPHRIPGTVLLKTEI